jgi:hypothetical protein
LDTRRTALLFGWFFVGTFICSIAAKVLFISGVGGSFSHLHYVSGTFSETKVQLGAILEFGLIVTNIATAVVIYPLVRRQSEKLALGYVTARVMESVFILVGIMSIMSILSINHAVAAANGDVTALTTQANSLAHTYDWTFLFGPGLVVGFGNGLILGYLMYKSGLMPRRLAMVGLVGGPLLIVSFVMILFGVYDNGSGPAGLMGLPEIVWELSLCVYPIWKGFRASPITTTVDIREPAPTASMVTV